MDEHLKVEDTNDVNNEFIEEIVILRSNGNRRPICTFIYQDNFKWYIKNKEKQQHTTQYYKITDKSTMSEKNNTKKQVNKISSLGTHGFLYPCLCLLLS